MWEERDTESRARNWLQQRLGVGEQSKKLASRAVWLDPGWCGEMMAEETGNVRCHTTGTWLQRWGTEAGRLNGSHHLTGCLKGLGPGDAAYQRQGEWEAAPQTITSKKTWPRVLVCPRERTQVFNTGTKWGGIVVQVLV